MRILLLLFIFIFSTSCGGKKKNQESTSRPMPDLPGIQDSKILSKLKNTSWTLPGFEEAGISIKKDKVSVSMNKNSYLSNADVVLLVEDSNFVVFNLYDETNNQVFGLMIIDPTTISLSVISESNSLEGYKKRQSILGAQMKKK